ncbi:hypothetical protein D9M71_548300 [compost metagenome]
MGDISSELGQVGRESAEATGPQRYPLDTSTGKDMLLPLEIAYHSANISDPYRPLKFIDPVLLLSPGLPEAIFAGTFRRVLPAPRVGAGPASRPGGHGLSQVIRGHGPRVVRGPWRAFRTRPHG